MGDWGGARSHRLLQTGVGPPNGGITAGRDTAGVEHGERGVAAKLVVALARGDEGRLLFSHLARRPTVSGNYT